MLFILIIFYLLFSSLAVEVLLHLLKNAPLGWEDEDGFHFGHPAMNKTL
jgi:hypothetical protein